MARKQKKRAARWDRHGRAQKSSERNEKRKNLMKQSKNRHWKEKDKKRRSRNRAKMKSLRNQERTSGLKKRSYWTNAMAWLQQLARRNQHTHLNQIAEEHHSTNTGPAENRSRLAGCGRILRRPQAENQLGSNLSENWNRTRTLSCAPARRKHSQARRYRYRY